MITSRHSCGLNVFSIAGDAGYCPGYLFCYLQFGTVLPSWILWKKFCETSNSTGKSIICRPSALNKILTKTSVWLSVHMFSGCSKLLESLGKELSLGAGKWRSLQAGFTLHLLIRYKCPWHTWGPGVSGLLKIACKFTLKSKVSELLSRLRRAAKTATSSAQLVYHAGSWHKPYPLCPSL